jgi:hypothetical protein
MYFFISYMGLWVLAETPGIPCALCFPGDECFDMIRTQIASRERGVASHVIASEAKQSSGSPGLWIASSLSLLAMTGQARP